MKYIILVIILAFASSLPAAKNDEKNPVDSIVEAYRKGKTKEATEELKKLDPDSYKAIEDLIKRVIKQEKTVKEAKRQLEVQEKFLKALDARLAKEVELMFKAHPPKEG